MPSVSDYLDDLQAAGRFVFTTEQAVEALGVSVTAARAALRRLKRKTSVRRPVSRLPRRCASSLSALGCLPADQFIPDLMAHLGEPYYVGLLSGGEVPRGLGIRRRSCFRLSYPSHDGRCNAEVSGWSSSPGETCTKLPSSRRNTQTGTIRIATPEATAIEVVGYP